jgi:hypothetical protein
MVWTGPAFVDAHAHLLRHAAGTLRAVTAETRTIEQWHRELAARGSTPMDEPALEPAVDDLGATLAAALGHAAASGLAEITEMGITDWRFLDALRDLRAAHGLALAVRLYVASGLAAATGPAGVAARRTGDTALEVEGVKFYADGWLGPRTCCLRESFADRPGDRGITFLSADQIARRAAPFADVELTIACHAIGDRAMDNVLDAYERIWGRDTPRAKPRVEHAQVLHPDLAARMAELGVVACIQPSFAVSDRHHIRDGLAGARAATAYRWADLLDAGVEVVAGSDFPIEVLEPLVGLQHLVTGAPLDAPGTPVAHRLPLDTALTLMTDERAGTMTLSDDPRAVPSDGLAGLEVLGTSPTR